MGYSNSGSGSVSYSLLADLIQLYGMDMGELLRINKGKEAGKPWVCHRSGLHDLWCGSHDSVSDPAAAGRSWTVAVSWRNHPADHSGVSYSMGDGDAVSHKMVGLQ